MVNTFEVFSDNNSLTYVLVTAKLDALGHQWVASLANYNFAVYYKSGKSNSEVDALSKVSGNQPFKLSSMKFSGARGLYGGLHLQYLGL